ncbi:hypothetical protein AB9F35_01545 [Rhizobium leguminosarum]|uniref:hypothetical protein n=1 Tax=Rhizobium leguminosarum TaxID=384 RepID=UPI003F94CF7B
MPDVITQIERADTTIIHGLADAGVPIVHDAQGRTGPLAGRLRPIFASARIAASAVTISGPPGAPIGRCSCH